MIASTRSLPAAILLRPRHPSALLLGATLPRALHRRASTNNSKSAADANLAHSFSPFAATPSDRHQLQNPHVNPPSTTNPAPLSIPPRDPDQSFFSYAFASGRAYWAFYKTGLKNILENRRLAAAAVERAGGRRVFKDAVKRLDRDTLRRLPFTRAEWQLYLRSGHDLRRVPVFALVLLVLGEWLPLVVVFCTPIVPLTCRIPRQVNKVIVMAERGKGREIQASLEHAGRSGVAQSKGAATGAGAGAAGLSSWPPAWWTWQLQARKRKMLAVDDELLVRDGQVKDLRPEELRIACYDRNYPLLGRSRDELTKVLQDHLARMPYTSKT